MKELKFYKLNAVPVTWEANAFYLINGTYNDGTADVNYAETYVTSSAGIPRAVGNATMIDEIISKKIIESTGPKSFKIVADITARDAITVTDATYLVLVLDASADATVTSGAALYAYDHNVPTFHKVAEYESMDVTLEWSAIQNKPSSSVVNIDDAVTKRHEHSNKAAIDKISESVEGKMLYDGNPVGNSWTASPEW